MLSATVLVVKGGGTGLLEFPNYGRLGDPLEPDRGAAAPVSGVVPHSGTHILMSQQLAIQDVPSVQSLVVSQVGNWSQVSGDSKHLLRLVPATK